MSLGRGDYAILHIGFFATDEKGVESVFHISGAWWGRDKVV